MCQSPLGASEDVREGFCVEFDPGRYIEHFKETAKLGNPDARLRLGQELSGGVARRGPPHYIRVTEPFDRLEQPHGEVRRRVHVCQRARRGEVQGRDGDVVLLHGNNENGKMFFEVGMTYEFGLFKIEKDLVEAAGWYKYGVDMGHEKCILC